MNDTRSTAASTGGEYLSFTLGNEHYGVDILKVQEIRGYDAVTRVPDAPDYIKGVINLRGTIVPVIDLRLKLRLDEARYDAFTVMIVLNVDDRVVGIVVDSVSDVIPLNAEQIRPKPEFGAAVALSWRMPAGQEGALCRAVTELSRGTVSVSVSAPVFAPY